MKIIIGLAFLMLSTTGLCQNKAHKKVNKQRDSVYFTQDVDTTFGTIEYKLSDGGLVRGEGIIIKVQSWEMHQMIPPTPIHYITKGKDTVGAVLGGDLTGWGSGNRTNGYIKTYKGYLRIDEPYVFTPKL